MGRFSRGFYKRQRLEAKATEILSRPRGQKCSQCDGIVTKSLRGFCDVCDDVKWDAETEAREMTGDDMRWDAEVEAREECNPDGCCENWEGGEE